MALRVTIEGRDREAMTDLVRRHAVDVVRTTTQQKGDGGYAVDAVLPRDRVDELTAAGYRVEVLEDAEEVAKQRRKDIQWHPDDVPGGGRPGRVRDLPGRVRDVRDRGPIE